jgi:hypothetical protein
MKILEMNAYNAVPLDWQQPKAPLASVFDLKDLWRYDSEGDETITQIRQATKITSCHKSGSSLKTPPNPHEIFGEIHANRAIDRKSRLRPKF